MITIPLTIYPEDKILVLSPHPDDESIGVGGLLALYSKQISVIVMTDGRYGNDRYDAFEMKKIREQEFVNAMEVVGISDYKFIKIEDGLLIENKNVFNDIEFENYTIVFLPNPNDNHSDHTACHEFAMDCIRARSLACDVYQYEVHKPLSDVDFHLNITGVIEKKISMINCHNSQMETHKYGEQIRALAKYRGLQNEQSESYLEVYHKVSSNYENQKDIGLEIEASKYRQFTRILTKWLHIETRITELGEYLKEKNINNIAIYGFGVLGKALYDCLRNSGCNIKYIIDKNKTADIDIPTYHEISSLDVVDIIIVTTVSGYEEIKNEIVENSKLDCISISSLVEEIAHG